MISLQPHERSLGELLETVETDPAVSLAPITEAVGGTYSLLFRTGPNGIVLEGRCHGAGTGYVDRLKEASHLRLLPAWLGGLEPGSVVDRAAFGSDLQFARSDFCNHVVRPEGSFHCVIATPFAHGDDRFHLVVGRPRSRNEFDAESRRLLRWMLPQVAEILRLRADLDATRRCLSHAERALDGLQEAVFVVARDSTAISTNATARHLVVTRDAVWLDPRGRLTAATPIEARKLREAVQRVAEDGAKTIMLLPRRLAQRAPVRLTLTRLPDPAAGEKVLAVVDASEPVDEAERIVGAARSYGLTRRECEVVTLLAQGLTLRTTARDLGMSYNTARSYVRQVFEKTSVHRQNDLLRLFTTGHHPADRSRG